VIGHINIRSLRHKIPDLHEILHAHQLHILSINETHLDSTIPDFNIHVPGYSVFRRDRDGHGGGVCFYVLTSLQATILPPSSDISPEVEALHLQLTIPSKPRPIKLRLSTVYRPPTTPVDFWDKLSHHVDSVIEGTDHYILLGDLNTDVLSPGSSHHLPHLMQLCSEHGLQNIVKEPTRSPSNTCLDLALVHTKLSWKDLSVTSVDDLSDHHFVQFNVNIPHWEPPPSTSGRYVRRPPIS